MFYLQKMQGADGEKLLVGSKWMYVLLPLVSFGSATVCVDSEPGRWVQTISKEGRVEGLEAGAADTLLVSQSAGRMMLPISMVMLPNANQCCWGFSIQEAFLSACWPQLRVFLPSEDEGHLLVFCSINCSSTMLEQCW